MPKKSRISAPKNRGKTAKPIVTKQAKHATVSKIEVDSYSPKWAFRRMDWTFSFDLDATVCKSGQLLSSGEKIECCFHNLSQRLKGFEAQSWQEIKQNDQTGSHYISINDLKSKNKAAATRLEKMATDEGIEQLFSLRIGSKERLWGIILEDGTFEALWYDPCHKVWPIAPN